MRGVYLLWENGEFCAVGGGLADVFACCCVVFFDGEVLEYCD